MSSQDIKKASGPVISPSSASIPSPAKNFKLSPLDVSTSPSNVPSALSTKVPNMPATSLEGFAGNLKSLQDDLDLKLKAVLYSIAINQNVSTMEQYNVQLHRENNELRKQITDMKKEMVAKELEFSQDLDSSMFEDVFEEEGEETTKDAKLPTQDDKEEESSNKE